MSITITVFKDKDRYDKDLSKKALELGINYKKNKKKVWESAKEQIDVVDFTQTIRTSSAFDNLSNKEEIAVSLAYDIAQGRNFKVKM